MVWRPLSRDELQSTISRELSDCSDDQRAYFKRVAFEPTKWRQCHMVTRVGASGPLPRTTTGCLVQRH